MLTDSQFRGMMRALGGFQGRPPRGHTWERNRWALRRNAAREKLHNLLRWPTLIQTAVVGDTDFVRAEFEELRALLDTDILADPGVGQGPMIRDTPYSTVLTHQAYHLTRWMKAAGQVPAGLKSVVEVGGGVGAMALVLRRMGFEGHYVCYDLPEMALVQRYWLDRVLDRRWRTLTQTSGVRANEWPPKERKDLLIGCYSLSEMPRAQAEAWLGTPWRWCLVAHQDSFGDRQHLHREFIDYAASRPDKVWRSVPNAHQPGHWYLIGGPK